ncbi:MAG TPA: glycosyltransferase N-terminal domain-containing protein [Gemmatimonadaceae bacterium]|nr:glycosyltransferase N-terminal domain-containing protein [Gemmatimonadaceae bacterium]
MHFLLRAPYALIGSVAEAAVALAPAGSAKWQRALRGRHGLEKRLSQFQRDDTRPLIWFHAPSVGESLQALPVVERLRAQSQPPQVAVTWYSPSAEAFAKRFDVDYRDYLAFDTTRGAHRALDALRPNALVYAKLDVWPVLTARASARGVPVGMISATLSEGSRRRGGVARMLLRDAYARLALVGAITADDAERLVDLGVRRDAIRVTGDTRCDQVWERVRATDRSRPPLSDLVSDRPTLVAGSTWPSDEAHLLPAWDLVRREIPTARIIIAPHEPTSAHTDPLVAWAKRVGLSAAVLSDRNAASADVVIVDRVGVLADLYSLGLIAFVGGGFHAAGLHSVLEPAAAGAAVVHGPGWRDSPDAGRLIAAGAGAAVADGAELARTLIGWLRDPASARGVGAHGTAFVQSHLGAADRALSLISELRALKG